MGVGGAAGRAAGVDALRGQGSDCEWTRARKDGARVLGLRGARARAADGNPAAELMWVHDVTELTRAVERAEAERDSVAGLLDALPLPVWRRDKDLKLVYCNRAYGRAVDEEPAAALTKAVELLGKAKSEAGRAIARRALASGQAESESHHVVVEGSRRLLEVGEHPAGDGTLVGVALDRTDAEELQAELARHIGAHADVLENLGSAIAIFGPDLKLRFFNSS